MDLKKGKNLTFKLTNFQLKKNGAYKNITKYDHFKRKKIKSTEIVVKIRW